eukprot:2924324-Prymnesium_polylepis.1
MDEAANIYGMVIRMHAAYSYLCVTCMTASLLRSRSIVTSFTPPGGVLGPERAFSLFFAESGGAAPAEGGDFRSTTFALCAWAAVAVPCSPLGLFFSLSPVSSSTMVSSISRWYSRAPSLRPALCEHMRRKQKRAAQPERSEIGRPTLRKAG